jgi:hypothetical protein
MAVWLPHTVRTARLARPGAEPASSTKRAAAGDAPGSVQDTVTQEGRAGARYPRFGLQTAMCHPRGRGPRPKAQDGVVRAGNHVPPVWGERGVERLGTLAWRQVRAARALADQRQVLANRQRVEVDQQRPMPIPANHEGKVRRDQDRVPAWRGRHDAVDRFAAQGTEWRRNRDRQQATALYIEQGQIPAVVGQ